MKKRLISLLLIVIILFNFIYVKPVYADTNPTSSTTHTNPVYNVAAEGDTNTIGSTTDSDAVDSTTYNSQSTAATVVFGIVSMLINAIPLTFELIMTAYTADIELNGSSTSGNNDTSFSIQRTVFNKIGAFNIDYFNFDNQYTVGFGANEEQVTVSDGIIGIRENVAKWFYILRIVALSVALLVLIYVGMRMALSTVASEKAVYKKMLINWVESVIILFLLQYIIQLILYIGEMFENICFNLKTQLESTGELSFEQKILNDLADRFYMSTSNDIINNTLTLWVLFFIHGRFFLLYIKRFFMTGFLILTAPLITITYPIDKMSDNKAQAFSAWFRELLISAFIQPLHAVIYLVFGFTAGEVMKVAPLLALILLGMMSQAESIVRHVFTMRGGGMVVSELSKEGIGRKK